MLGLSSCGGEGALQVGNRVIATIFHGDFGISPKLDRELKHFIQLSPLLSRIVVSNENMFHRLVNWGISLEQLVLIPIGVDLSRFSPIVADVKRQLRKRYAIPENAICIGSFQKDGEVWPGGEYPKYIKGPDVFVEVVAELVKEFPVHCLLTGPSRSYVQHCLDSKGIPYSHHYISDYDEMVNLYRCLDLYLITSREEGGPKAVLEAAASGIPIVSTRVGMVSKVMADSEMIADDIPGLIRCAHKILSNSEFSKTFSIENYRAVQQYDWGIVSAQYQKLYKEVMS